MRLGERRGGAVGRVVKVEVRAGPSRDQSTRVMVMRAAGGAHRRRGTLLPRRAPGATDPHRPHAIADLDGADAARVSREAAASGVEATPLAAYCVAREKPANALMLGFAAVRPEVARRGMERLAAAIEAARRR